MWVNGINNKTENDISKIDKANNQTILHTTCLSDKNLKEAFLFLESILTKQSFITYLFEFAFRNEDAFIAEIRTKYINNNNELFRAWLYISNFKFITW